LILAFRLPFLNQAIQGDEVYYLKAAEHAQIEPLHPNHTSYLFMGDMVDMRGHPHPPLNSWILGGLLWALGDVREIPFHLAYIVFSLIASLAMLWLAHRFSSQPMLATVLFCAVPAFVINGSSLEADLPFLAFWMLAIALFVKGVDADSAWVVGASAIASGIAALGAYQVVFLTPILATYLMSAKCRRVSAWLATLAAPATLAAWQLWERASSGALPASQLAGYLNSYGLEAVTNKIRGTAALVVHLGWMVFPLILIALMARSGRWRLVLTVVAGASAAVFDSNPFFWVTFACGVWMISFCLGKGFLGWWVLIFFAGAVAVFFAGSARYLLPIAAPVAILVANEVRPRVAMIGCALGLLLGIGLAFANYQHWDSYRQFAKSLEKDTAERRVWVNAEWGLRYYLESEGALAIDKGHVVKTGEMVTSSSLALPVSVGALARVRETAIRPSLPFRLISLSGRSAYSTAGGGLLPFEVSHGVLDRVDVDIASAPTMSFLDLKDARSWSQIVSGIFPDGWMGKQAVVILKSKANAGRVVASFFLPPNAPARRVRLDAAGVVVERKFPGPGAYELSADIPAATDTLTVTISVDQTFSVPGDVRTLGMVVQGIGFR
jgi:4-amino-4-deoxy-L-arabinose transferase-like glycosyltransferase